jgi:hypothetical protein
LSAWRSCGGWRSPLETAVVNGARYLLPPAATLAARSSARRSCIQAGGRIGVPSHSHPRKQVGTLDIHQAALGRASQPPLPLCGGHEQQCSGPERGGGLRLLLLLALAGPLQSFTLLWLGSRRLTRRSLRHTRAPARPPPCNRHFAPVGSKMFLNCPPLEPRVRGVHALLGGESERSALSLL